MNVVTWLLRLFRRRTRRLVSTASIAMAGLTVAFVCLARSGYLRQSRVSAVGHLENWDGRDGQWPYAVRQQQLQPTCTEKRNFAYIKMIKCASSTTAAVLRRFGLVRNLSFVLPPKDRIYIGWPYDIDETLYRPAKTPHPFNILCEHAVYKRQTFRRILTAPDTVYFTTLREPFSQFKSMLNYYNVFNISGITANHDPLREYLENLDRYEAAYKSPEAAATRYCIPDGFSMTRNLMSYNLGFPTGFLPGTSDMSQDDAFIADWIKGLDEDFRLVMMTEHFHESMVLLRRLMCWTLGDIIFLSSNKLGYGYRNRVDATLVETYRRWSRVDYILYDHFNASFWERLGKQSADFWAEVQQFRRVNQAVNKFCESGDESVSLTVPESTWHDRFVVTASFCETLKEELLPKLHRNYEILAPTLDEPKPSKSTC